MLSIDGLSVLSINRMDAVTAVVRSVFRETGKDTEKIPKRTIMIPKRIHAHT